MIFPFSDKQKVFLRESFDIDPSVDMDDDKQFDLEDKVSAYLQTYGINDAGDGVNGIGFMCEEILTVIAKNG